MRVEVGRVVGPNSKKTLATTGVILAVVSWGLGTVMVKAASVPALVFALYRLWLGTFVLLGVLAIMGRRLTLETIWTSALGGVLFGLNVVLLFAALKLTNIVDATLIGVLQPALVLLVAGRWFGERVGIQEIIWVAVSIVGVGAVVVGSAGTPVWSLRGDALAVGGLLTWTGYFLVSKRLLLQVAPVDYLAAVILISAIIVTPITLVFSRDLEVTHARDVLLILVFTLVPGLLGHAIVIWAHKYVDVWVSSLLVVGVPIVSATAGLIILGEPLGLLQVAGGIMAIGAIGAIIGHSSLGETKDWPAKAGVTPRL